ncbi:MAG: hypothetical protein AB7R89_28680 [Dehalococcoidia bacterium]
MASNNTSTTTNTRHGWYDLPSGGALKFEGGYPVRLSDGATRQDDEWDGVDEQTLIREASALAGYALYVAEGSWDSASFEPDATARVEIHVFVDSSDDQDRSAEAWEDIGQQVVQEDIPAALSGVVGWTDTEADEGVMYTGPAEIYDRIVATVAGRCAVYRG